MGQQIILMYDVLQAIRPANVTREMFKQLTACYEKKFLHTQFRIQAPKGKSYTSDDYVNGIKYLLFKDTGLLDSELTNFDPNFNRDVFRDKSEDAYFGYVLGKPMHQLINGVLLMEKTHQSLTSTKMGCIEDGIRLKRIGLISVMQMLKIR